MAEHLIRLQPHQIGDLFANWPETLIWSALDGSMGCFYALSESPKAAICETGDFLFLAGGTQEAETRELLEAWKDERGSFAILAPRDYDCGRLIEQIFGPKAKAGKRCAFQKGGENFDPVRLQAMVNALPQELTLAPFDCALYHQALQNSWSKDFVSQFRDADDFLTRGLGYAALCNGEMIGGASSYTCYQGGIEVQVETRADWQKRGVASACFAALILACLNRKCYPSWDAANPVSAALARKLGYHEAGLYPVWYMNNDE